MKKKILVLLLITIVTVIFLLLGILYVKKTNLKEEKDMFNFLQSESVDKEKNIERITYLEKKYGIVFPDILKSLYTKTNTGNIKDILFEVDGYKYGVWNLIPINPTAKMHFEFIADDDRDERFESEIPDSFYPLAIDRGGDIYYWSNDTKEVYFVIPDDMENPILIADSIEEFFELLNNSIVVEGN